MAGDELQKQGGLDEERVRQIELERERTRIQRDIDDERIRDIEREKKDRKK